MKTKKEKKEDKMLGLRWDAGSQVKEQRDIRGKVPLLVLTRLTSPGFSLGGVARDIWEDR